MSNRADRIWLPEHVAAFMAAATPKLQLALLLGLHTGQRQGDIRAMQWGQYDGQAISLTQGKGKVRVWDPMHAYTDRPNSTALNEPGTRSSLTVTAAYGRSAHSQERGDAPTKQPACLPEMMGCTSTICVGRL